jgi:Phage capsid protein
MYKDNISMLLQQKGSKLRDLVDVASDYVGVGAKVVEQFGNSAAVEITGRDTDTPLQNSNADARWIYPKDAVSAELVANFDKLRMIIEPDSKFAMSQVYALGRYIDFTILNAYFGTNATGATGAVQTPFLASNIVPVNFNSSANNGLTFAKLLEARSILGSNEVDLDNEELICLLTTRDHNRLLSEVEVASREFNTTPVYENGMISSFLGIRFKTIEMLSQPAFLSGGFRQVPVYCKSRMHLGLWSDITTDISERKDKNLAIQVYSKVTCGATRLEEAGCVSILVTGV